MDEVQKSETAKREEATLAFWKERDIFKKSLAKEAPNGDFVFYDGPPFATGFPHYGHIVASVIKDVVPRYWTMRGYHVPRVWGWDCHGLPIENIVEKELGFKHKKEIKEHGVAKFNELCRERVLTYAHEWEKIIPRIGRWADMENAYRTMDKPFMESVWWVFKQIYDKGLVYEDYRSMHICPRCETTLSQQEVSEGYKDVKDISVTVKFNLVDEPETYFLAWTTTPWTLPGNIALAVGRDLEYLKIANMPDVRRGPGHVFKREFYWVAKDIFDKQASPITPRPEEDAFMFFGMLVKTTGDTQKGAAFIGKKYEPLFDYYTKDESLKNRENGWKVYAADFVSTGEGTGTVHIAPAFGADDWALAQKENLPVVQHVNMDGTFKGEVKDFAGLEVKPIEDPTRTDVEVLKYLAKNGLLFAKEKIEHPYPHCWRCDTPLLNYLTTSWFVSVTKIKDKLLKNAKAINWSPSHIKEGRFGKWLEGARDWSISRQRFWASVIPIWRCERCKKERVFGGAQELEAASGRKIDDLHKHIVDEITFACECGSMMHRISDVLDTWFDSGSMPYGERHYPFAFSTDSQGAALGFLKVGPWSKIFPAQFIAEGLDQTRAWFYYLHVLGGALFNKNAFQNVVVNGIVLAEDGKKMSKKLQNYPDPMEVVDKYGADALRLYLLSSPVMQAENLAFAEKGVDEIARKNIGRLGNVLAFYQLYADPIRNSSSSNGAGGTSRSNKSQNVLDRWILARLGQLIRESTQGFEKYQLDAATRPIAFFIDDLSAWYLRRSRERISAKGRSASGGKEGKQQALATLRYVLHTLARVIAPSMPFFAERLYQAVKEGNDPESVHLAEWPLTPHTGFFSGLFKKRDDGVLKAMADARAIVTQALEARDKAGIKVRQPLASLSIPTSSKLTDEYLSIIADEVNVKTVRKAGDDVVLDTALTLELKEEGFIRDLIRAIQDARKTAGLNPRDSARLTISTSDAKEIIERNDSAIKQATTVSKISFGEAKAEPEDIGGYQIAIFLEARS